MANPEPKRTGWILFWIAGLVVAAGIFFAVRALSHEAVSVRVVPVTTQTLLDTVGTNGKVEPVAEFQAHAPGPGTVKNIFVNIGEHVTKGQLLVSMNDDDAVAHIAAAKANLSASQLTLSDLQHGGNTEDLARFGSDTSTARLEQKNAAANLAQLQALERRGSSSPAEVAVAQQRLDAANLVLKNATGHSAGRFNPADIANAKARVADNQSALMAAQAQYDALNIRSKIAGSVYSIPFSQYDFVPNGTDDILAVADLNHMRVRAYFDEPEIGRLANGQAVKISWEAKPNITWHGHIEIAPTTVVPYGTRSVGECLIAVDDSHGDLLPNTNVSIVVTRSQRFNVLTIPREALHTDGFKKFVYRIVNGKLARTAVTTDIVGLVSVQITSGLQERDVVVLGPTVPGRDLVDGMEVKATQ